MEMRTQSELWTSKMRSENLPKSKRVDLEPFTRTDLNWLVW